jgi:hypothetical protein
LFTIGVVLLVDSGADEIAVGGKQWGQRYLLILIPLISFLAVQELNYLRETSHSLPRNLSFFLVGALLIVGLHKNLYQGTVFFQKAHQGVAPAIQGLQKNSNNTIVVSHQYAAQMLEPSLREKIFFRTEDNKKLVKLGATLVEQNQSSFIYVCYPHHKCKITQASPERFKFSARNKNFHIELSSLGKMGKYPIYEAKIKQLEKTNSI